MLLSWSSTSMLKSEDTALGWKNIDFLKHIFKKYRHFSLGLPYFTSLGCVHGP